MNRRTAVAAGAVLALFSGYSLADQAMRWAELTTSAAPADKKLVAEIERMQWWDACAAWGREYRAHKDSRREQAFRNYLHYKNYLLPVDESHVNDRSVAIGMGECGVMAAKGRPDAINSTETKSGRTSQIVYRQSRTYVYTEPTADRFPLNVVRSIQY